MSNLINLNLEFIIVLWLLKVRIFSVLAKFYISCALVEALLQLSAKIMLESIVCGKFSNPIAKKLNCFRNCSINPRFLAGIMISQTTRCKMINAAEFYGILSMR